MYALICSYSGFVTVFMWKEIDLTKSRLSFIMCANWLYENGLLKCLIISME